jgi:hypothetical protein
MNDEEKKAFLRKMGYAGSSMRTAEESIIKKKKKVGTGDDDLPKGHVYKSDLLALNRIFNQRPAVPNRPEIYKEDNDKQ